MSDLRYAIRMLFKSPGFALVSILALGLGIGANSTIYGGLRAMVLQPLAFHDLDQILVISERLPQSGNNGVSVAPANYRDIAEHNSVFEHVAALRGRGWDANLTGHGAPQRLEGYEVTPSLFPLLGMAPLVGRTFSDQDATESGARVIVLSYGAWQRHFGGDPNIVGRALVLNGAQTTVLAVMPPEFDFPIGADVWTPLPMNAPEMASRSDHNLDVLARMKPGVSMDAVRADLDKLAANLELQYPASNAGRHFATLLLRKQVSGGTRQFTLVLMWAAVFVLLLACANVANLQLARSMGRQKEIAVRAALGASRWRVARQVLVESTVLSLAGGAAGLLIAAWAIPLTRNDVPAFILQHIAGVKNIRLDGRVVLFTAVVSLLTGVLAGLIPALQAAGSSALSDALKEGVRGSASAPVRRRMRSLLVVTEVALALVLLVGAGLMVKGFNNLVAEYPGFDAYSVLSMRVTLPEKKYTSQQQRASFYDRALQRLAAIPGVDSAAAGRFLPNAWAWQSGTLAIENVVAHPGELRFAGMQAVSPDFFRTLKIPLRSGRVITPQDGLDATPVAVLSESVARRWWPAGDAVGHRIRFGEKQPWRMVVGVVADIRQNAFDDEPRPTVYMPLAQQPPVNVGFMLSTRRDPLSLAAAAREAIRSVDSEQPAYDIRTLRQMLTDNASGVQYAAHMMIAFGMIALLLATAGIYAVMAYAVAQRTHEIGVRMALGAQHADVLRMVVGNSLKLAGIGLAIGVPAALAMSKLLASMLLGIVRLDALVFVSLTLMLAAVGALAGYLPARRAARVDPMVALRYE